MSKNSSFYGLSQNQHLSPSRSIPQKSRSEIGANEIPRSSTPNLDLPTTSHSQLGRSHSPGGSLAGSDRNEMLTMKIAPSMESVASLGRQVWSKKINAHQRTNSDLQISEGRNVSGESNVSARSNTLANASAAITGLTTSTDVNSLQLENTLLRQEIANLNSEIAMLSDRCEYTKTQLNAKVSQGREQGQALDSYQKQVGVLHEDNIKKQNELDATHAKMQDSTTQIMKLNAALNSTKTEHEILKSSHGHSNSAQQSAIDIIENKLEECEVKLKNERERILELENKLADQDQTHISEISGLTVNIKELDSNLKVERRKIGTVNNSNKQLKTQLETIKQELEDYKNKAQRILQSKERLIANLKTNGVGGGSGELETSVQLETTLNELVEFKVERDELKQELNKLRQTSQTVEMEYAQVEGELTKDNSDLRDQLNELTSNHQLEHQQRIEAEKEVSRIRKNKHDLQLELTSNKHEYAQRMQDRDTEVCRLRNQVLMKSEKGPQQNELEKRIHHLTETLLTKQSVIENLNTSKHSLGLQLERSQSQLNKMQQNFPDENRIRERRLAHSVPVLIEDEEIRELDRSKPLTRGAKKTMRAIDIFSIRLGVFLRRYPIARLFLLFYGFMLHVWVMVILLVDEPEVHSPGEKALFHYDDPDAM
jgi:predicted  nucleic acid-binding Zn-ribbon protein